MIRWLPTMDRRAAEIDARRLKEGKKGHHAVFLAGYIPVVIQGRYFRFSCSRDAYAVRGQRYQRWLESYNSCAIGSSVELVRS